MSNILIVSLVALGIVHTVIVSAIWFSIGYINGKKR